jgi:short-subunit dehydrogenase involved in D-alanine esterification of teichoic acids
VEYYVLNLQISANCDSNDDNSLHCQSVIFLETNFANINNIFNSAGVYDK